MTTDIKSQEPGEDVQENNKDRESTAEGKNPTDEDRNENDTETKGNDMPTEPNPVNSINKDVIAEYSARHLNDEERLQLYQKGVEFRRLGSNQHALLCFLGCLRDLKANSKFSAMPECLQYVAEIFASNDDYERAVQFIQAAKLYYETAIIRSHISADEGAIEERERKDVPVYMPLDENAQSEIARRANEYEKLSHSCLKEKNIQLALEYCGKATQLRRSHYGDNHPISVKSLDLFTVIYAEMGKMQYSEAVSKLSNKPREEDTSRQEDTVIDKEKDKVIKPTDNDKLENQSKRVTFDLPEDSKEEIINNVSQPRREVDDPREAKSDMKRIDETDIELQQSSSFYLFVFILLSAGLAILLTAGWYRLTTTYQWPSYAYIKQRLRFCYYYWSQVFFKAETYF